MASIATERPATRTSRVKSPGEWRRLATTFVSSPRCTSSAGSRWWRSSHRSTTAWATSLGIGIGVTAYTLGLRHAFDADHIAAIDNTTRKLMSDGQRPLCRASSSPSATRGSSSRWPCCCRSGSRPSRRRSRTTLALTTTPALSVPWSPGFLYLIAIINLCPGRHPRVFAEMRTGRFDEAALEQQLNNRGLLIRFLGRSGRSPSRGRCTRSACCSGSGFDTATEIAFSSWPVPVPRPGLPWYAILCLPILFAAGMSLLDTLDGSFMNFAYGWAFSNRSARSTTTSRSPDCRSRSR